jgi:hypothetical protein
MKYCLIMAVFLVGCPPHLFAQEQQVLAGPTPLNLSTEAAPAMPVVPVAPARAAGYELRGCIKIDNTQIDKVPEYRIYYQGREQRSNSEGFFSFALENKDLSKYSLVICKSLDQQFEKGNTIGRYGVVPNKDYRYFRFKKGQQGEWLAQEKKLTKKQFAIPGHALVALIDPKCVDRLDPWDVNVADSVIKLPVIILRSDLDQKKLRRYSAKSMLYALDSRPFHRTERLERRSASKNPRVQLVLDR